jgi:hypothetical protein
VLAALHVGIAATLAHRSWLWVAGASASVGALLAFDLQAVSHELCHQRHMPLKHHRRRTPSALLAHIGYLLCHRWTSTVSFHPAPFA